MIHISQILLEAMDASINPPPGSDRYEVSVQNVSEDGALFELTLVGRAGRRYPCTETCCTFSGDSKLTWEVLRENLRSCGLADIPPMVLNKFTLRMEEGAVIGTPPLSRTSLGEVHVDGTPRAERDAR